jgi:hypothetical protein
MSAPALAWFTWWLIPAILGGLFAAFMALMFIVALFEKNPVHNYDPAPISGVPPDLPSYVAAMNDAAVRTGYVPGGLYRNTASRTEKSYASLWQSPDRRVLVEITGGTTLKLVRRRTRMYSRTSAGRYLVTTDDFDAGDTSGIQDLERVLYGDFEELLVAHLRRVQALGPQGVPPMEAVTPLEAQREIEDRLLAATMARGMGRWAKKDRSAWAYSVKGAVWLCTVGMFGDFARNMGQSERASRARPGDKARSRFTVLTPPPPRQERDFIP